VRKKVAVKTDTGRRLAWVYLPRPGVPLAETAWTPQKSRK